MEDHLDWMSSEDKSDLPSVIVVQTGTTGADDDDHGPAQQQTLDVMEGDPNDIETSGILGDENSPFLSDNDKSLICEITKQSDGTSLGCMNWPTIEKEALCEYSDNPIFCMAFPWLFPGSCGKTGLIQFL